MAVFSRSSTSSSRAHLADPVAVGAGQDLARRGPASPPARRPCAAPRAPRRPARSAASPARPGRGSAAATGRPRRSAPAAACAAARRRGRAAGRNSAARTRLKPVWKSATARAGSGSNCTISGPIRCSSASADDAAEQRGSAGCRSAGAAPPGSSPDTPSSTGLIAVPRLAPSTRAKAASRRHRRPWRRTT